MDRFNERGGASMLSKTEARPDFQRKKEMLV
jgi:hypothetical protein